MPRLRVLAGPNANQLTEISTEVNTFRTHRITSDRFDGEVCVHIKGFIGADGNLKESTYFPDSKAGSNRNARQEESGGSSASSVSGDSNGSTSNGSRKGVTWSIQVRGRYLVHGLTMDDVLFGNTFDRPLKLPWGSGAALKFMNFVDPTLEHALDSAQPWALSPLVATMPHFAISTKKGHSHPLATPDGTYVQDDTSQLKNVPSFKNASARRQYFANVSNRQRVHLSKDETITTDFCYGFLSFPEIRLNLPGGISFDLMKYWDGQPVRFVCCERRKDEQSGNGRVKGPGDPFWVVVFEAVFDEDEPVTPDGASVKDDSQFDPEEQKHLQEDID